MTVAARVAAIPREAAMRAWRIAAVAGRLVEG